MREIKFRAWDEQNKIMHYNFNFIRSGVEGNDRIMFGIKNTNCGDTKGE